MLLDRPDRDDDSHFSLLLPVWCGAAEGCRNLDIALLRGGIAQMARAMALQAIGLGFESPYLQIVG